METLMANARDMSKKGRQLRKQGFITGSISGKKLEHSISLQIPEKNVKQFMLHHTVGSKALVNVDGTKYMTMIKSADFSVLTNHFIDMTFQQLQADEKVKGEAEIILENEDRANGFITINCNEIEYEAYPADIVDHIVINVADYPVNTELQVKDLDIAKNDRIHILTPLDTSVLHVSEHRHIKAEDRALLEEEDADSTDTSAS